MARIERQPVGLYSQMRKFSSVMYCTVIQSPCSHQQLNDSRVLSHYSRKLLSLQMLCRSSRYHAGRVGSISKDRELKKPFCHVDQLEVFSASEIAYMPAYRVGNFKSWMRCQCEVTTPLHFKTSLPPAPKLVESNEVDM
jgi:hypothetical protein